MQSPSYSCQILERLEFCGQIFEKYSKSIHENPSRGSLGFPCGRMDGQADRQP
jgi:hypothetical protein